MAWATTGSESFLISLSSEGSERILVGCGPRRFKGHCKKSPISLECVSIYLTISLNRNGIYPLIVEIGNHQLCSRLLRICKFRNNTWLACYYLAADHRACYRLKGGLDIGSCCPRRKVPSDDNEWARGTLNGHVAATG